MARPVAAERNAARLKRSVCTASSNVLSGQGLNMVLHMTAPAQGGVYPLSIRMVQDGAVVSVTGKVIKMRTDTVCIHGDTPGAVDIARGVRQALKNAGIAVAPFKVS